MKTVGLVLIAAALSGSHSGSELKAVVRVILLHTHLRKLIIDVKSGD